MMLMVFAFVSGCSSEMSIKSFSYKLENEIYNKESVHADTLLKMNFSDDAAEEMVSYEMNQAIDYSMLALESHSVLKDTLQVNDKKTSTENEWYTQSEEEATKVFYVKKEDVWTSQVEEVQGNIDIEKSLQALVDTVLNLDDVDVVEGEKIDGRKTVEVKWDTSFSKVVSLMGINKNTYSSLVDEAKSDQIFEVKITAFEKDCLLAKLEINLKENKTIAANDLVLAGQKDFIKPFYLNAFSYLVTFDFDTFNETSLVPIEVLDEANGLIEQTRVWESGVIQMNGKEFTLGSFTIQDLFDLGYRFKDDSIQIDDAFYGYDDYFVMKKDGVFIGVEVNAANTDTAVLADLSVYGLMIKGSDSIVVDGGIKVGSTKEEVVKAFGEANDSTDYEQENHFYYSDTGMMTLQITYVDDVVSGLYLLDASWIY